MTCLDFSKPLYILAPLAGYTDLPFRRVVKKFGADLTVSEMISSNALVHNSKKTMKMLQKSDSENPYSVQIAGNKLDIVKSAVEILNAQDGIDIIDLNCGCPAPKVFNHGSGSNLLGDLDRMSDIIGVIKENSQKELMSVKMRLGVNDKNHVEIAKVAEAAGADFLAVHGRTRAGKYKAPVDYDALKEVKEAVKIPVIANGDITSFDKAKWVLEHTGCDGVMIGRGSIGKPWIFYQLKHNTEDISLELKEEIVLEHYDAMIDFYGEHGVPMFRKHLHTYSKGLKGAAAFRQISNETSGIDLMREAIVNFFREQ